MNIQLLKRLYSIYSPSGKEQKMVRFLCSYINGLPGEISLEKDSFGNLYVTKGSGESYPCLVSHLDQVSHCRHSKDFRAVEANENHYGVSIRMTISVAPKERQKPFIQKLNPIISAKERYLYTVLIKTEINTAQMISDRQSKIS